MPHRKNKSPALLITRIFFINKIRDRCSEQALIWYNQLPSAMVHPTVFWILSALMVAGAAGVLVARHPVYAVLSLVVTLFGLSALFVCLGAYFVATVQVLVYAGAILVLFLFVVMLLDLAPESLSRARVNTLRVGGILAGLFFFRQAARVAGSFGALLPAEKAEPGTTAAVGRILFSTYALPFEAASLLLLVGIIGAVVLAQKKPENLKGSDPSKKGQTP